MSVASLIWEEAPKRSVNAGAPFWLDVLAQGASAAVIPQGNVSITSSDPSVVSVPSDPGHLGGQGWREVRCTGVGPGTATVTVTAGSYSLSQQVTVVAAPADRYRYGLRATTPRTYDDTDAVDGNLTVDPTTKKIVGPKAGAPGRGAHFYVARPAVANSITLTPVADVPTNRAALLAAVNARINTGGTIYLAGGEWGAEIQIENPNGTKATPIVIADDRYRTGTFPRAEGVDVSLADGAGMPTFTATTANAAVWLGQTAKWVRFMGCRFKAAQDGIQRNGGVITSRDSNTGLIKSANLADYPSHITFEQCVVDGLGVGRGSWVNATFCAWLNCRVDRINGVTNGDRQGTCIDEAGPYYFRDGYIAGNQGESLSVSAGSASARATVPHDIWIDGTIFSGYDLGTAGQKNMVECKGVRRMLMTNYLVVDFTSAGYGGQYWHVIFKTSTNNIDANDARDVIVRGGRHYNSTGACVVVLAADVLCETVTHRVDISHIASDTPHAGSPDANDLAGGMFIVDGGIVYNPPAVGGYYNNATITSANQERYSLRDVSIHHATQNGMPSTNLLYSRFVTVSRGAPGGRFPRLTIRGCIDGRRDDAGNKNAFLATPGYYDNTLLGTYNGLVADGLIDADTTAGGVTSHAIAGNLYSGGYSTAQSGTFNASIANLAAFKFNTDSSLQAGSPGLTSDVDGGVGGADPALVPSLRTY